MVQDDKQGETFRCAECGLRYPNRDLAEQCEAWCREHRSCNIEIIKHALPEGAADSK